MESRYSSLIQEAGRRLKESPVGAVNGLQRRWEAVAWNELDDQRVLTDAEASRDGQGRITLYPSLLRQPPQSASAALLREFGRLLFAGAPRKLQRRWTHKLGLPTAQQIDAIQAKLIPESKSYRSLVESFDRSLDRYVAINIVNALIAKGVPFGQVNNVNIREWGATQEYANRRRYHILIPLVSAYSSKEIFEDFGTALADWICGTNGITESSVAEATHGIIREVLEGLG
jgi:hypothetical protein